ncbi:MAG: hypothetical protein ACE5G3_05830 [Gammaproteobacteria bacterium]
MVGARGAADRYSGARVYTGAPPVQRRPLFDKRGRQGAVSRTVPVGTGPLYTHAGQAVPFLLGAVLILPALGLLWLFRLRPELLAYATPRPPDG